AGAPTRCSRIIRGARSASRLRHCDRGSRTQVLTRRERGAMARIASPRVDERMQRFALIAWVLAGCLHHGSPRPIEGAVLERVVVYRNGVAFYERRATAVDGKLNVRVPRERVDDFLKSLTVVDPRTGHPLAVSIPRTERDDGGGRDSYLTMTLDASE